MFSTEVKKAEQVSVCTKKSPPTKVSVDKVGAARFELATSWSQTRRDNRATLRPAKWGAKIRVELFTAKRIIAAHKPPLPSTLQYSSFGEEAAYQSFPLRIIEPKHGSESYKYIPDLIE